MTRPPNTPLPMLDLDVLRSFVAIAEARSFSTAATVVHRTPSAVSMQIKKLEETLGRPVFLREARSVSLTADGEILLGYARRLLTISGEAVSKFLTAEASGVVRLGAPDNVGERVLPAVLGRFAQTHPTIVVDVVIDQTVNLKQRLAEGTLDLTFLTCKPDGLPPGAETVLVEPLVWAGLNGGSAHMKRPLPISIWEDGCIWRAAALAALDVAGIEHRVAYMSAHIAGQRAAVESDLAVAPLPLSFVNAAQLVALGPGHGLPDLGTYALAMVVGDSAGSAARVAADHIRQILSNSRASVVGIDAAGGEGSRTQQNLSAG